MKKLMIFLIFLLGVSISAQAFDVNVPSTAIRLMTANEYLDIAYNGDIYVMVGKSGLIAVSKNLKEWREIQGITYKDVTGIEWTGSEFVALGEYILRSPDGIDWTKENNELFVGTNNFKWTGSNFLVERKYSKTTTSAMTVLCTTVDFQSYTDFEFKIVQQYSDSTFIDNYPVPKTIHYINGYCLAIYADEILYMDSSNKWQKVTQAFKDMRYFAYVNNKYTVYSVENYNVYAYTSADLKIWEKTELNLPDKRTNLSKEQVLFVSGGGSIYALYSVNGPDLKTYFKGAISKDGLVFEQMGDMLSDVIEVRKFCYEGDAPIALCRHFLIYKSGDKWEKSDRANVIGINKETAGWTGKEFIKWNITGEVLRSADGLEWEVLPMNDYEKNLLYGRDDSFQILWADGVYMIRYKVFDNYDPSRYKLTPSNNEIIFTDENFNLIRSVGFGNYIKAMSYAKGMYYYRADKTYASKDGENWYALGDDMGIPVYNGKESILSVAGKSRGEWSVPDFLHINVSNNGVDFQEVAYERGRKEKVNVLKDYYITTKAGKANESRDIVSLSEEGVYWMDIELPDSQMDINEIYTKGNKIFIQTQNWIFIYSKDSVEEKFNQLFETGKKFVNVNHKVLGFDTPPVIENDRMLVPMRFLFEQMGAQVSWDNDTKTATATKGDKVVSFSIDNISATVNNSMKTMDVPARLVNDKTMIPLRFLSKELGYEVEWDEKTKVATIKEDASK